MYDTVRLALVYLERTYLIDEFVDDIPKVEGVEHSHTEVDRELQAGLTTGSFNTVRLLEQQNTKAIESRIVQRKTILRFVHAEAARPAGTGSEENVVVDDLFPRLPLLFEFLKVSHQISYGEVGRVALAIVA